MEKKKRTRNKEFKLACGPQMADTNRKKKTPIYQSYDTIIFEQQLRILECKILGKIFGSGQTEDGSWRSQMKNNVDQLIHGTDTVWFMKTRSPEWLDHAR